MIYIKQGKTRQWRTSRIQELVIESDDIELNGPADGGYAPGPSTGRGSVIPGLDIKLQLTDQTKYFRKPRISYERFPAFRRISRDLNNAVYHFIFIAPSIDVVKAIIKNLLVESLDFTQMIVQGLTEISPKIDSSWALEIEQLSKDIQTESLLEARSIPGWLADTIAEIITMAYIIGKLEKLTKISKYPVWAQYITKTVNDIFADAITAPRDKKEDAIKNSFIKSPILNNTKINKSLREVVDIVDTAIKKRNNSN